MVEQPRNPFPKPDAAASQQKRDAIDRGLEGDKVNYPDPATAPLGTDAEAGGEASSRQTTRGSAVRPEAAPRPNDPNPPRRGPMQVFLLAIAAVAAVIVIAALVIG